MISVLLKFIYLTIAAGLGVAGIKYSSIENRKVLMPVLLFIVAYFFASWGVLSLFDYREGYPHAWFFFLTSIPLWIAVVLVVINIKKK